MERGGTPDGLGEGGGAVRMLEGHSTPVRYERLRMKQLPKILFFSF